MFRSKSHTRQLALLVPIAGVLLIAAEPPKIAFSETTFDFGKAIRGTPVMHNFKVRNLGAATLGVTKISMTPPLVALEVPDRIVPGAEATIPFTLDTAQVRGLFEGRVLVFFAGSAQPEVLRFEGRVVETIEVSPRPAFFLGSRRGEARQASLDIINHEAEPLAIEAVEHATERFTTKLQTLEPGRRYRLTMMINPDGPGGRHREVITLKTGSKSHPLLSIAANTYLRERVYAFPEVVDFGAVAVSQIRATPGSSDALSQIIMVRQAGGNAFEIKLSSDLPFLSLKSERTPEGDGYQLSVSLIAQRVKPGAIHGRISIETNDAEFPSMVVPVSGFLLDR